MKPKDAVNHIVRSVAQVGAWGVTLLALTAAVPGHEISTLIAFASSVGGNLVANILDRASRNENIEPSELRSLLEDKLELESVRLLLQEEIVEAQLAKEVDKLSTQFSVIISQLSELSVNLKASAEEQRTESHARFDNLQTGQLAISMSIDSHLRQEMAAHLETHRKIDQLGERINSADFGLEKHEIRILARIEVANEQIASGRPLAALKVLENIDAQNVNSLSGNVRFRLWTAIGAAASLMADPSKADQYLARAQSLKPNDPVAASNAANSAAIVGDIVRALQLSEHARNLDPMSSGGTSALIKVLGRQERFDDLETLISSETWVTSDINCLCSLGLVYFDARRFDRAETWLRTAINVDKKRSDVHMMLAQTLFMPVMLRNDVDVALPGTLPANDCAKLSQAIDELSIVIELVKDTEYKDMIGLAFANRGALKAKLELRNEAMDDCNAALNYHPSNSVALRNKAQLLLTEGKYEEAIRFLLSIPEGQYQSAVLKPLAYSYIFTDKSKAISLLKPVWESSKTCEKSLEIGSLLLLAYQHSNDSLSSSELVEELENLWPDHPEALAARATELTRLGCDDEAADLWLRAADVAQGNLKNWINQSLAGFYYERGMFGSAADIYCKFVDVSNDSNNLRKYLYSLYRSDRHAEVLEVSARLRAGGPAIPVITELESTELEAIGRLSEAKALLEALKERDPQEYKHTVHLVRLLIRLEDENEARIKVESLHYDCIMNESEILIQVATLRTHLKMPFALKYAYRALRLSADGSDVPEQYLRLCLEQGDEEQKRYFYQPVAICSDCTVILKRGDEMLRLTLLDEQPIDSRLGEKLISDKLGMKLVGLKLGDKVDLNQAPFGTSNYSVEGILTKYAAEFQRVTEQVRSGLTRSKTVFIGDLAEEGAVEQLREELDRNRERGEQARGLYDDHKISLRMFGMYVGRSILDVWLAMTHSTTGALYADLSTIADINERLKASKEATGIALDTTALFALAQSPLREQITSRYRFLVAQHVVDEIRHELKELASCPRPTYTMWSEGGKYFHDKIADESIEIRMKLLQDALDISQSHADVVPADGLLAMDKKLVSAIGQPFAASIAVALDHKCSLYVDDIVSLQFLKQEYSIVGLSSISLAFALRDANLIGIPELTSQLLWLLKLNYRYVPVNVNITYHVFETNGFKVTDDLLRILKPLTGPVCSEESALAVATDILHRAWTRDMFDLVRQQLLHAVLSTVTAGRDSNRICQKLIGLMPGRFYLVPWRGEDLCGLIRAWKVGNAGGL